MWLVGWLAGKVVNPSNGYGECLQRCPRDQGYFAYLSCQVRCALVPGPWEQPEEEQPYEQQGSEEEQQQGGGGQQQQGEQEQQNPYHFPSHRFQTLYRSELGYARALPRDLIVELQHLKRADVLAVPAGSSVYAANKDNRQNLRVVQLAIPVTNPEQFQFFYPGGQQNPQSYYTGFSRQTLEAAFNEGQQPQGLIVRASWEQIRQLTQQARSGQEGSQGQSQSGPFNLENYELPVSNDYGRVWETRPNQTPQLRNLGVSSVGCAQLRQGALLLPHFNTEYTVVYVVEGNGTFEMACPHLSSQGQEEEQWEAGQIQSLTAEVSE
ncbi:hypothetical protein L6164_012769 [Bauhinia variegata]|uniref:Uncharacterized protein n=1 Tax=Bauhinia variegata TaxID=167791 RepID=A0ACB9PCL5_BAUVA|nr:hypothetical protein L6164_012769 [Bauhinia variegata]